MKKNENMLSYIEKYKSKRGINFATRDGALYHSLRVVFTLGFIYIMVFHLLYLLSEITHKAETTYVTVAVCAAGIILGYILNSTKFKLAGCLVTFIPLLINVCIFYNISIVPDNSVSAKEFLGTAAHFYYRFALPALVILFAIIFMSVIDIRSKLKTNKLYRHLEEELYRQHKDYDLSSLTSEQWEEIIESAK